MKIDPNAPAMPNPELSKSHFGHVEAYLGLTIRQELAARAMQGILARNGVGGKEQETSTAQYAVAYADALIAELNKEAGKS